MRTVAISSMIALFPRRRLRWQTRVVGDYVFLTACAAQAYLGAAAASSQSGDWENVEKGLETASGHHRLHVIIDG
jgi:hypothetical protein